MSEPHVLELTALRVELDQGREADDRNDQRAPVADLLETATMARQGVAFDRDQQFALFERRPIGADDELVELHAPAQDFAAGAFRQLDFRVIGDQHRRYVSRRRGVDDVAADGGLRANLFVGEPHRAALHARQRAGERGIVEKALDRRRGAEPHAAVVDAQFAQIRNARHIDQHRDFHVARPALARPGQRIGAAGHNPVTAAVALHRGKGLIQRARRQILFADKHGLAFFRSNREHLLVQCPASTA